ncbi:FAD-dependent oxidoreductase [Anaerotalea alkaliphila]|uniref:oxidoreductase n=1 Tax=Anaerotalea alkaliphila TaxID=2662126 RepID=UPI001BACD50C|nr:FAD-dependent oxidoreductase [Anaerotalea alkaliphila]
MGFSACLAKNGGADAVELHAYGGYLIDQFQSALWNKRTDEYGGDLQGRMRFTLELVAEIQKTCGKDFPLLVKFTPHHGIPGGRELEEGIEMAKMLEAAGVHALHIDKGCYERWFDAISTVYEPEAAQIDLADAIRKHVRIPVISQGKLGNPEVAERVLQEGKTDFVGLAHQMLCDPHWVNKVKEGKTYDIVPCIGCNECLYAGFAGKHYVCAVNVGCYHEDDYPLLPAREKKSVLVVGGGPGGMQAAIAAAERGFSVELWERQNTLGGTLLAAGAPSFKGDVLKFVEVFKNKLYRSGVVVRLMKEAAAEEILRKGFDKVILAAGATPCLPPVPGIDGGNVCTSTAALLGQAPLGKKVVVIGGGLVGCETALHIQETADQVSVVEMLDDILLTADHCLNNDQKLRLLIAESGMAIHTKAKVTRIGTDFVEFEKDGATDRIPCDSVVIATGYKSNNQLARELEGQMDLSVVGDAGSPRKILHAVHEAYHAVRLYS